MSGFGARGLSRRAALLGAAGGLAGCGFHPLYATRNGQSSPAQLELAAIDVGIIPDRPGQLLRQALQARFEGSGMALAKRYALSVSYGVAGDPISVQRDSTPTRLREIGTAQWTLKQLDPASTLVTSGTARSLDGVNIIDQQYFAADLEGEAAQHRLAENIADQITLQLASYFTRRRTV